SGFSGFRGNHAATTHSEDANDQAPSGEVQDRPTHGPEYLGPAEVAYQQTRIWPRPARPAPQGQALRLRRAIARQAEAQGLLRQFVGTALPRSLRRGAAAEGRYRRQYDRAPRAPARYCDLSREIRADRVRRSPIHQP